MIAVSCVRSFRRVRRWACLPLVFVSLLLAAGCAPVTLAADAPSACEELPVARIFERDAASVVVISTFEINPYTTLDRIVAGTGSGFFVDNKGLIVTNSHVVYGARHINVTTSDGRQFSARMVGADPIFDVGLIQIEGAGDARFRPAMLADSDLVSPGEDAMAIGAPLGLGYSITRGVVSALNRALPDRPLLLATPFIQIDTPINPGNSGGPLLDRCGRVIGVNTAMIEGSQNIGFAIPINLVKAVIPELAKHGRLIRPWMGFQGQFIDAKLLSEILRVPLVDGYLVEVLEPGGPAAKAGLRGGELPISIAGHDMLLGGDIIVEANGIKATDLERLAEEIPKLKVGSHLRLKVFRNGTYATVEYDMPERPLLPGDVQR